MERYIKLYDSVIDKNVCDSMITLFETQKDLQAVDRINPIMDFKEINLMQNKDVWGQHISYLSNAFKQVLEQYRVECNVEHWPAKYAFEEIRMKKYEPDTGKFNQHVDVGDYSTARRFLAFFAYLNPGVSGETAFDDLGLVVPRNTGSVLVFPPMWTYPHTGRIPKVNPKYIIGSYLHYV
tara:strand:+ start:1030 stop:1569 length:540 start_codon:yes stop_codon:yes gene_type:complete